jgi:hypothetical protein
MLRTSPVTSAGAPLRPCAARGQVQDRLALSAGGGLRIAFGDVQGELFAEQLALRLNPRALFAPDTGGTATLRNLSYGVGLVVPLVRGDDEGDEGLRGTSAPIEPFVGRLDFADALRLDRQQVAGVRAGLYLSPMFGLRGFWWRGVGDDGAREMSGYGGEAQFTFTGGPGLTPFLVVGAGTVDFSPDFRDSTGAARRDKGTVILGAGLSWRLSDRVRINGAIRDYVMTLDDDLDAVETSGDLVHNPLLSAGFTLSLGGRGGAGSTGSGATRTGSRRERERLRDREELYALRDELRRRDSLDALRVDRMRGEATTGRGVALRDTGTDSLGVPVGASERWITVPVPAHGEIILRFGTTSARAGDSAAIGAVVSDDASIARLLDIERRLTARLDAMQRQLGQPPLVVQPQVVAPGQATPRVTVITGGDSTSVTSARETRALVQRVVSTRPRDIMPYAGLATGRNTQLVLGARADLGGLTPVSGFHFVPELAVGLGEGTTSVLAFANARYAFGSVSGTQALRPYVTLGAGVYSPTVLGINTALGTSIALRRANASPLSVHIELQGINLFNDTRLLLGLSRNR